MWWRLRGRRLVVVLGCLLVLTGLGITINALVQQANVESAVNARGENDINAVNNWLSGSALSGPSSPEPSSTATGVCGGGGSDSQAYALVQFTGVPGYGYAGVAVDGNWSRLHDRSMVHWYDSPAPGGVGNVIIAFHREPDFQFIDHLVVGGTITVQDRSCQSYVYTVTQRWDEAPAAVNQLVPTDGHELTLITCTPWWQDYDRMVWRAELTSVDGVPVSPSPS